MTCCYCIYAYLIVFITTQKPHDPVNLKKKKKLFLSLQMELITTKKETHTERKEKRKKEATFQNVAWYSEVY
jgi:hypothetical protein